MNATLFIVGLALLAADPAPQSNPDDSLVNAKDGVAGSSRFESRGASPAVPLDADDRAKDTAPAKSRFGASRFTPAARTTIPDAAKKDAATGRFRFGASIPPPADEQAAQGKPIGKAEPLVPIEKGIAPTPPADAKLPKEKLKKKLAALVLAQALEAPKKDFLAGRPISLEQAFSLARSSPERIGVAGAYWTLSAATADYHLAVRHHGRLGTLQKLVERHGRAGDAALIAAAMTAGKAHVHKMHVAAIVAQHELATLLRQSTADSLPLAEDIPLAAAYRTSFASIFAARPAPARARLIDRTLPIRLQEITARTDAVLAADEAFRSQQDAYRLGQIYLPAVLASDEALRRQWQQFDAAVYAYNDDILEYAGMVGGHTASDASLVGMLIDVTTKTAPGWSPKKQPTLAEPLDSVLRK
jgi:hypothetical protein